MKDLARKFGFMVTMLTIMMAGFTFAACGSDDDNDPGTDNLEGAGKTGEFVVKGAYECSDLNYAYWYNNDEDGINLTFLNFDATSINNVPKDIHALTVRLPITELKEGVYKCEFDFDANANSDGGCSLFTDNSSVVISNTKGVWGVVISGWDGIYQTYDPDTYSKGAMFTFCYVGNIKYNSLLEEQ